MSKTEGKKEKKKKETRNLDFPVSVCILKVLLMLGTTFSEKIYTGTKFLPMRIQHYIDAIGDIRICYRIDNVCLFVDVVPHIWRQALTVSLVDEDPSFFCSFGSFGFISIF